MEISHVRQRILATIERARQRDAERRARTDEAARAYSTFLDTIAVPIFRQVANVLRAEGYLFGVFTPSGSVTLVSDRSAQDSIGIALDTTGDAPLVVGRTSRSRGGRVIESERPVGDPATLGEADLLEFVMKELEGLVSR
jgi:hypothetical protein